MNEPIDIDDMRKYGTRKMLRLALIRLELIDNAFADLRAFLVNIESQLKAAENMDAQD